MYLYNKIIELGIEHIYRYVMENNKSKCLPYHNNFHLENVCKYSLILAEKSGLSIEEQKILATAAFFHDFDHSGGIHKDDSENITLSMRGFLEFDRWLKYMGYKHYSTDEKLTIYRLILGTKYPYTSDGNDLSESGKILRDADILQGLFCENHINGVIRAISVESGKSFDEMIKGQLDFITGVKYLTKHAQDMSNAKIPEIIELLALVKKFEKTPIKTNIN